MCLCVDWNIFVYWRIHVCSYLTRQGLGWLDASAGTVEHVPLDGFKLGWSMGETDEKCGVYSVYPQKTGIWLDLTYETGGINTYIYIYICLFVFNKFWEDIWKWLQGLWWSCWAADSKSLVVEVDQNRWYP